MMYRTLQLFIVVTGLFSGTLPLTATQTAGATGPPARLGELRLAERIEAQRRIERIFYERRIWPKDNPQPKPSFEEMVPAAAIERKAVDSLRKTAALGQFWSVEISTAMLQTEMDRMARDTKNPEMLRVLFAALGDDPRLVAETLARDHLSDRMIRDRYARDPTLHTAARRNSEAVFAESKNGDWRKLAEREGWAWSRRKIITAAGSAEIQDEFDRGDTERVTGDALEALRRRHPAGALSLQESAAGFVIEKSVSIVSDQLEIETLFVPKFSFDVWWKEQTVSLAVTVTVRDGDYRLPEIAAMTACDQWTPTSLVNAPLGRSQHTAVWTGVEMVVWGGNNTGDVSGGRYYPVTDSWLPTSMGTGVPSARVAATSVWTGNEMIVWGGFNGFSALNTGSRYNPSTDSWSPTSMTGVPTPRYGHTAIWTGAAMIIWSTGTGGIYNPFANSWSPTSTSNAPAITRHKAVWTGNEMIVWGGLLNNPGGRYNPISDSWVPTSMNNVPIGRQYHTAVWTGSEMIVWGGDYQYLGAPCYCYATTATGGKYDPALDRWLPTSLGTNVPIARSEHAAIWTGSDMIVWGGGYNSGGRYYPGSDNWLLTSVGANVPTPRTWNSTVWTGDSMIIWGGGNTGGVYTSGAAGSPANSLRGTKSSVINLQWPSISGAGSYNVKRADLATALFPYTPTTIVSTPTIPQYSEPDDGQSHFYAVEAVNQCGATP